MKAKIYIIVLFLGVIMVSNSNGKNVFPGEEWHTATPESQGIDSKKLEEAINYLREGTGEDGVSQVVVVKNGYVIWQGDDINNKHVIWSCSKSFLSTCFGLLWSDGKCTPDTLAKDYFPEMSKYYPTVILKDLGTFTSGYNNVPGNVLEPAEPMYQPGDAFHYSRQSDVLAYILTNIANESLHDIFKRRIADKIGIKDEEMGWFVFATNQNDVAVNGGSGAPGTSVSITASAMARFGWLYANNGVWKEERLINQEYIDYASKPQVPAKVAMYDKKAWYADLPGRYGLNWWTNGQNLKKDWLWPDAPKNTFAAQGNKNNICFIVRDWDMVIVRMGLDKNISMEPYNQMFKAIKEGIKK